MNFHSQLPSALKTTDGESRPIVAMGRCLSRSWAYANGAGARPEVDFEPAK